MKIQPIAKYRTPDYPSLIAAQRDKELLSGLPGRWRRAPGFSVVLGLLAGLSTRLASAGSGSEAATDAKAAVAQAPGSPSPAPDASAATRQVQRATSIVAPLLDEALAHDGRGAFGCVALNPPTFLSEDEAIELIRAELQEAGLKLRADVEVSNVEAPADDGALMDAVESDGADDAGDQKTEVRIVRDVGRGPRARLVSREFVFDLADPDRAVFIEYLSQRDHRDWEGESMSTVSSFDFPSLARRVTNSLQKVRSDKPMVFGVFFDPLARAEVPSPEVSGLSPSQRRLAMDEHARAQRQEREHMDDKNKEKLRQQVRSFVKFLRQAGIVGTAK